MNIYLLERQTGTEWDQMDSVVLIAEDTGDARHSARSYEPDLTARNDWSDPSKTSCVKVGTDDDLILRSVTWG